MVKVAPQEAAIVPSVGPTPSGWRAKLRTNKRFQQVVAATTIFAVFCDILGSAIIMPGMVSVCAWADGGPADNIMNLPLSDAEKLAMTQQYVSPHAFKDPKPPFKFSLSMNMVMSAGAVGSALGSFTFGRLVDKIGCKIPMQICLFAGIGGYIIVYAAAIWVKSYWLFMFGNVWNSFFGVSMDIAMTYFGQLFEGAERDNYQGAVLGMGLVGGTIGAFIVMPFSNNPQNGENYFEAVWLALGFTVLAFILITVILVPPEVKTEEVKEGLGPGGTSPMARRILILAVVASALDSGGDEGTRMARGTILTAVFPAWQTAERQNYLLMGLLIMVIFTMAILSVMRKAMGLAAIAVVGCGATFAVQLILMIEWDDVPFLLIWYVGKLFGFLSTIASGFIITEVAPKEALGRWNGINQGATNLSMAVSPLIFATIYDVVGNVRGQEMLASTAVISFLAIVAYAPLIRMMPKPPPPEKPLEMQELEVYEEMTDAEWNKVPQEVKDQVTASLLQAGRKPRIAYWGVYTEERSTLYELQKNAVKDFKYLSNYTIRLLSNRNLLMQEQQTYKEFMEKAPTVDRDKAKLEMGTWIADYFDDAGYTDWQTQTSIFKTMIMTAFPPIDPLDDVKPDFATMPIEKFEENATKVLAVMDSHLAAEQRRIRNFGSCSLNSLIRRR
eukprot:TRINITY_DN67485_c0_g1_i1.p1 TRINITY_DN67485_c0_g1~~TRINITY_DN67485_c0_g1_i1.p1  ORF type:complete len:670 (-),score=115.42 TRINITY_DN67485_c0_g1_i1:232-2241(-)